MKDVFDVIIVGGGVIGCGIARELSRFRLNIIVLEQFNDVSAGTSKANSGIVHAGFDAEPGSLKAKYNIEGAKMFPELARELDFPYRKNGAMVLCFCDEDKPRLDELLRKGEENGAEGLRIIDGDEARRIEPHISEKTAYALYAPSSGIVSPYEMNIAYAENAYKNGVRFEFDTQVTGIVRSVDYFDVTCRDGRSFKGRTVINAAGVFADEINNMVCEKKLEIIARRGEYSLLDKNCGYLTDTTLFQLPTSMGKGILVAPTTHGNILVGPTAHDTRDKWNVDTTAECQNELFEKGTKSVPELDRRYVIKQYCGLRAHSVANDFEIGWSDAENFYNVAGIESPGLSAAPAVAVKVAKDVAVRLKAEKNESFDGTRKGIFRFATATDDERRKKIAENPLYGKIVCRCENVTEGEIVDSIARPLGAVDLDGVKRRTRAGMGRCQSGFCCTRVMEILSEQLGVPFEDIKLNGNGKMVVGRLKQNGVGRPLGRLEEI